MEMRRLGRNGLEVPALCLGTMTFGFQVDEPRSVEILDAAWRDGSAGSLHEFARRAHDSSARYWNITEGAA